MPQLALLMLVGTLAIAGLPPLNGFVPNGCCCRHFLLSPGLPHPTSTCWFRLRRRHWCWPQRWPVCDGENFTA